MFMPINPSFDYSPKVLPTACETSVLTVAVASKEKSPWFEVMSSFERDVAACVVHCLEMEWSDNREEEPIDEKQPMPLMQQHLQVILDKKSIGLQSMACYFGIHYSRDTMMTSELQSQQEFEDDDAFDDTVVFLDILQDKKRLRLREHMILCYGEEDDDRLDHNVMEESQE